MPVGEDVEGCLRVGENGRRAACERVVDVVVAVGRFAAHGDEEVTRLDLARVIGDAGERDGFAAPGDGVDFVEYGAGIHRVILIECGVADAIRVETTAASD
jgi:hypothetical protein